MIFNSIIYLYSNVKDKYLMTLNMFELENFKSDKIPMTLSGELPHVYFPILEIQILHQIEHA